jgi:hypothetical protein
MLIIAGLATADFIFGSGAGLLAAYRILLMGFGLDQEHTTPWLCLITPVFLTHIGSELTAVMNVAVSMDRYIAVAFPVKYRNLGEGYAFKLLAGVLLYATISMVTMFSSVYFGMNNVVTNSTLTRLCSGTIFPNWFPMFEQTFDLSVSLTGVLIYVGVYLAYRRATSKVTPIETNNAVQTAMQHRLTVTLGIITCSTFIFFVIPYVVFTLFAWLRLPTPYVILWGTMSRFSTIINVTIYVYRQKEVRNAMYNLLTCTKLATGFTAHHSNK